MDQKGIQPSCLLAKYSRRKRVDFACDGHFAFRPVDGGIGGSVDDNFRLQLTKLSAEFVRLREVEASVIERSQGANGAKTAF